MAPYSNTLAWRIPGTGEPGGLPSMGSHRVGHDWSDLAAAAAAVGVESIQSICQHISEQLPWERMVMANFVLLDWAMVSRYLIKHYSGFFCEGVFVCVCVSCSVVSNSLQPHGLWPTRLLCPWNSPGKNTEWVAVYSPGALPDPGSSDLLHCKQILYHLSHQGSPRREEAFCISQGLQHI